MRLIGVMAAVAALTPASLGTATASPGVAYICSAERWRPAQAPERLTILAGMGEGGIAAAVGRPGAQQWLDYGLRLYHAFYHEEAKQAFANAAAQDRNCALCAWGEALGLGPTLNFGVPQEQTAKALAAAERAAALARTPLERDLAGALVRRYAAELTPQAREARYAAEMEALVPRYPDEPDLSALAAHALLTAGRQGDRTATERAMTVLERRLARAPDDTAAIHFYIHAAEAAGRPAAALPYAERLASLAPNASHLVHMAAHTLVRVGRYEDVALVNAEALKVDADFLAARSAKGTLGEPRYYVHNVMFGVFGAIMAGDRGLALKYADHGPVAFPAGADPVRRATVMAKTKVAYARFAPDKALAIAPPGAGEPVFHTLYWRYARGEAYAAKRDLAGLDAELRALEAVATPAGGGNPELKALATKVLAGRAAMLRGDAAGAAVVFEEAASLQEKSFSQTYDPPPWWYQVRRSLAAARLKAGDYRAAADQARASLKAMPNDGLALRVLAQAERRLGERAAADRDGAAARRAWRGNVDAVALDLI